MALRVYNTLTRTKEPFVPLHAPKVSMFVCGLTPQDQTHLGHAKTYVAFDIVARYLRHKGFEVFYLQNVTDIEDRIIEKMQATGQDWKAIVEHYMAEYREVMGALRCTSVDLYAFATQYIPQIVAQIQGLLTKGFAYVAPDGSVYYDTTKFRDWGKLSGQKVEALRPGARVTVDENKRNPADFALWKAQKPGEPAWDSPWGQGRPGWHIEDTAITIHQFGPQYDIHGGATELMFPHHEAEMAQAEAFTGVIPFVKYWMHGGMLMVKGEEMHKSLGNFWAVKDALATFPAEHLRFFFLNAHYRSPIDFTPEAIKEAGTSYDRLRETVRSIAAERRRAPETGPADTTLLIATERATETFDAAMEDDFNTREAIAALFEYVREVNKALERGAGRKELDRAADAFSIFGKVLGIFEEKARDGGLVAGLAALVESLGEAAVPTPDPALAADAMMDQLIALRDAARKRKDFAAADRIRSALGTLGVVLEDTKDGVRWKRK